MLINLEFGVLNFQKCSLVVSFFADEHTHTAAAVVTSWGSLEFLWLFAGLIDKSITSVDICATW